MTAKILEGYLFILSFNSSITEKMKRFLLRRIEKLSFEIILLAVLFFVCLWALFSIADMVFEDKNTRFDEQVFSWIVPHTNSRTTAFMQFITFFGSPMFLLPANIILAGVFLFTRNHQIYTLKVAAVALTSTGVMFLLKIILQRERPLVPLISKAHGYSFPSGHSFSSLVFFGMLGYIIFRTINNKPLKWLLVISCFLFAILIGLSRIYLKVHFASDVIAGFCLGIIWLLLAKWLLVKTQKMVIPEF
jgi:membrane-associated phospholipid phosphatase